jgi:hypothetical protein
MDAIHSQRAYACPARQDRGATALTGEVEYLPVRASGEVPVAKGGVDGLS